MSQRTATLRAARALSPDVRELTFDPGAGFDFKPGQWVSLKIPQPDGAVIPRSYSIASAPRPDGCFDLAVTRVEGGPGSTWLHAVEPGTSLPITEATGFFTLPDHPARPVLMVATGTGVAPMRAMLQAAFAHTPSVPFTLLFGVRTAADAIYADEFRALAERSEGFRFELTLSRPDEGAAGRAGYVQLHVPTLVRDLGGDCDVYVCGLNAMVRDVRRVLKEDLGFTRDRVHTERYD